MQKYGGDGLNVDEAKENMQINFDCVFTTK